MKVEPDRSGRKRILSSTSGAEMEPDRKLCRLSVVAGRSPLKPIQQSRRRSKPPLTKKSSLTEGCLEVSAAPRARAAPGGVRPAAAPPAKITHNYETRAAANRKRAEYAGLEKRRISVEKKAELAAEKPPPPSADETDRATERPESADEEDIVVPPDLVACHPVPSAVTESPASQPAEIPEDEYIEDILRELLNQEQVQRLETDFLAGQHTVTATDRAVVVDWLILVQHYLRLENGTLQLAVALLDRVLADFSCPLDSLQLLGVACLWLAAKMEEPRLPSARQLLKLTMDGYAMSSLLDMELLVLHVTEFRLLRVHPAALVSLQLHRRCPTAGRQGTRFGQTCSYLLDLASCRLGGVHRPPSLVAAGVIHTARLLLPGHQHGGTVDSEPDHFCHREEEVLNIATLLLLELRDSLTSKLQGARKKYSSLSRYQSLALSEELSSEQVQRVLLRHLSRPLPLPPPPVTPAAAADLSEEY